MRELTVLFIQLIVTATKLMRPGGERSVVAESLLLKPSTLLALHAALVKRKYRRQTHRHLEYKV